MKSSTEVTVPAATPDIIHNDDGSLIYLPMVGGLVTLIDDPAAYPSTPVEKVSTRGDYVAWGDDNDYPGYIEERAHRSTLIPSTLQFKAMYMAAADIHYGYITGFDKKTNRPVIERFIHPELEYFWSRNNKRLFLEDTYRNLYWWSHAYIEFVLNKEKTRIVALSTHDTCHCRLSAQDKRTGIKPFLYIDANYPMPSEETTTTVRLLDPYWDWTGQIRKTPGYKFIYPLFFNSPKRTFYQRTPWHSIFDSKWADLAEKIPVFKAKLMDNQMVIKYIFHVPEDYWRIEYPKWDSMTAAERMKARVDRTREFNNVLAGIEKTGKSVMLTFRTDAAARQFSKWEVQELKGNLGSGEYIEDSQEISEHTLYALAFDGTLIGKTPGKSIGAGSGSDKRLADEIFFKNNKPYALKVIEALSVMTDYNQYKAPGGQRIVWFQEEQILTTLNNVNPEYRP